jgi:hypothetical protein
MISPRKPEYPVVEKGSGAEKIWPAVTVKGTGFPIIAPAAFVKVIVPVQDSAVGTVMIVVVGRPVYVAAADVRLATFT